MQTHSATPRRRNCQVSDVFPQILSLYSAILNRSNPHHDAQLHLGHRLKTSHCHSSEQSLGSSPFMGLLSYSLQIIRIINGLLSA